MPDPLQRSAFQAAQDAAQARQRDNHPGLDAQRQRNLEEQMMDWLRLQIFLIFFVSPFLVLLYFWLGVNVVYYGLEIIVPVLETTAKVCRSFQGLLEPVSSLLWYLVRWLGYL
ncbi:hypothetical protein GE21DRAFT_6854 [Neurospora crassa]|uniref:Uncharacterized protein n=1 Tax=Neurospora crassa (strain ATCC 24698 / 74-OR23-1A / CBS 708.71 / DSM 1257 / FGSC 987) TaxID=367110 RepID=V5INL5_NEUCR|nr:hypothetical protein NCU16916 [Neurospora crassa OR74A]ESA42351.1 hypothetical protein NCU16916 [Neurospora crassa OR74A]KHE80284.1 hypothetical protein GE21DRAFT_6854 [Neurospora crassa]|eukprot:XP_011394800.1 hypothetical protein NCU16916 [Neurospora crassa OR74A]